MARNNFQGLVSAAYFSDTCRREADELGIAHTEDAGFLVAGFAQALAARAPDHGAEQRVGSYDAQLGSANCGLPVVALINLLPLNGIDAELVLLTSDSGSSPAERPDSVLTYVPVLDRYIDPGAADLHDLNLDHLVRQTRVRMHFVGPALRNDARSACHDVCLSIYSPKRDPYARRVKTEAIRTP